VFISNETRLFAWLHRAVGVTAASDVLVYREREAFTAHLQRELPKVVRQFYEGLAPPGTVHWGDKNPHYASPENRGCLETVAELFPTSRFVHLIRDGRDVVASGLRGVWRSFDSVHEMWTSHIEIGQRFGKEIGPTRYYELRYEDLVADDVTAAAGMFRFLRIEMHPAVATFCRAQRLQRTPFCDPTRDLSRDVTGSDWATVLSPAQRLRSLELLADDLVALGYETPSSLESALVNERAGLS
jgi:hypothetical protein